MAALAILGGAGPVSPLVWETLDPEDGMETTTWAGAIASAGGSSQHLTLTLFPDSTFRLRRTDPEARDGGSRGAYELGRWERRDGDRLVLRSGTREPRELRLVDPGTLRAVGPGRTYELARQGVVDPVPGPMPLRGMYAYLADAATFNECSTGRRFPVAFEGAQTEVERAYLEVAPSAGAPVLVSLTGRFDERPAMEGPDTDHLVIEELGRFWPGETCAREAMAMASLRNTYWRPVEIDGTPVTVAEGQREPHLLIEGDGDEARGFTGCNGFRGTVQHTDTRLRLGPLAVTRKACPSPAGETETRFLRALEATTSYRVVGDTLDLRDEDDEVRMRLEARYLG